MIQSPKNSARISEQTRTLITDYYKLSNNRVQTNNIPIASKKKRGSSPPSPSGSTRQSVVSDIKDHTSIGSIETEEQVSVDELHKLLLDPKLSKKDKERISKALLEGDIHHYHDYLSRAASRDDKRRQPKTESSEALLKELQRDKAHLLRMRHRLPKPHFLELTPASMTIPVRSGRDVREEKISLMRRGLTTAGHNPDGSPNSMGAVARRHQQLEQIQRMSFYNDAPPGEFVPHDAQAAYPGGSLELPASPSQMVESIMLMQSEQVHHVGHSRGASRRLHMTDDLLSANSSTADARAGGHALEHDRSINGDLAENSSIELSHHDGGDDFSALGGGARVAAKAAAGASPAPGTASDRSPGRAKDSFLLTTVPGQDTTPSLPPPDVTLSMINNLSEASLSSADRIVVDAHGNVLQGAQSPTVPPPAHAHVHRGLASAHPQHAQRVQHVQHARSRAPQLADHVVVTDANPRELYSQLARQDKRKRIAQLKLQLQAEKEHVQRLKAAAQEAIQQKVGLKKQLDGFRQKLKDYLEQHRHPLRGSILRCVDDSMVYHLLQRYDGFSLTPEAILLLLGSSLGTSILVDPTLQHERETGRPNNNVVSEHPDFAAWKAEEKAAHEHILMERLAPLLEAMAAEGVLPVKALAHDFHSTMTLNNYQHFGQRHPYRLPALMHVKKHADPRDKVERVALDPNPFRDHERSAEAEVLQQAALRRGRPSSGAPARPRVNLLPASPPGAALRASLLLPATAGAGLVRPWTTDAHREPSLHGADGALQLVQSLADTAGGRSRRSPSPPRGAAEAPASPTVGAGFRLVQASGRMSPLGLREGTAAQDDALLLRGATQPSLAKLVHGVRQDMLPRAMRPDALQLSTASKQLGGALLEDDDASDARRRPRGERDHDDDDVSSLGDDRSAAHGAAAAAALHDGGHAPAVRTLGKGDLGRAAAGLGVRAQTAISIMHESLVEEGILYVEPDQVLSDEQIAALGRRERTADAVISQVIRMQKFHEQQQAQLADEARRAALEAAAPPTAAEAASSVTDPTLSEPPPAALGDEAAAVAATPAAVVLQDSTTTGAASRSSLRGSASFEALLAGAQPVQRTASFAFALSPQLQQFEAEEERRPRALHSAATAFLNSPANPHFAPDAESVGSRSTADASELFKPDLLEMQQLAQRRQMIHTPLLATPDPKEKIDALIVAMSAHHKRPSAGSTADAARSAPRALKTRELLTIYHNRGSHEARWQQKDPGALGPPTEALAAPAHDDPRLLMLPVSSNETLPRAGVDPQSLPAISPYRGFPQEVQVMSSGVPAGAGLMLWRPRHVVNARDGHAQVARYGRAAARSRSPTNGRVARPFVSAT